MDADFDDIYFELYTEAYVGERRNDFNDAERMRGHASSSGSTLRVRRAIESASARNLRMGGPDLRPDAKYLLLLNLIEMVIKPLTARGSDSIYLQDDGLERDIQAIVQDASAHGARDLESSTVESLSAHRVIDALSRSWDRLNLSGIALWGA